LISGRKRNQEVRWKGQKIDGKVVKKISVSRLWRLLEKINEDYYVDLILDEMQE
jgi:hypothetical protein